MRRMLMLVLLGASSTRCCALGAALVLGGNLGFAPSLEPRQQKWLMDLVMMSPTVIFLSALSVVVLFFSQVYYTTMMTPMPMLEYVFLGINVSCYVLIAVVAGCSYVLLEYNIFREFMIIFIGFSSLFVAFSLFYYGMVVWSTLSEKTRKRPASQRLTKRVFALSTVCPGALLAQGSVYLVWTVMAGTHVNSFPVWENVA